MSTDTPKAEESTNDMNVNQPIDTTVTTEPALEPEPVEEKVLRGLIILPPLQKAGTQNERDERADGIPLPPIRPEEPVASIRAALQEVCGYAHLTNYRLVVEDAKEEESDGAVPPPSKVSVAGEPSPYTGPNAVVSVPMSLRALQNDGEKGAITSVENASVDSNNRVLDDFGDLSLLDANGLLTDGSAFRVVLERYDAATVRDHVMRLRALLDGNAPTTLSLGGPGAAGAEEEEEELAPVTIGDEDVPADKTADAKDGEAESSETNGYKDGRIGANGDKSKDKKEKDDVVTKMPPPDMPVFLDDKPVHPDTNDLKHFFYYACGEDPSLYLDDTKRLDSQGVNGRTKAKKKGKKKSSKGNVSGGSETSEETLRDLIPRLNELEEKTRVPCSIRYSGFHPPPRFRQLMGDIAYLEVTFPDGETNVITCTPLGFYVNGSSVIEGKHKFDPTPIQEPCFSHDLLDCLVQFSKSFAVAWQEAVTTANVRNELTAKINEDGPFLSFFRVATRGDFSGYKTPAVASAAEGIDALINVPSWLVPVPRAELDSAGSWNRNCEHNFNPARTEHDLSNSFGVDLRGGSTRDWNEELQVAREMPTASLMERIDRARLLNKVLTDFGEAAIQGVKAICDGQVSSMNPNEPARSQVFLHNNIFFSRAIDGGVETFKVARGDRAARKSASRDLSCLGVLHRMERTDLHTLATVLVDFLGTRYVCQSILPGILNGEKTHTLLYGTVEAGMPLVWDKEMHEILEQTIGKGLLIATRPIPREPLTESRAAEVDEAKSAFPLYLEMKANMEEKKQEGDLSPTVELCAPIEMKGIRGSDQRKYVLDVTRLSPRDANWIPNEKGGTGCWEAVGKKGNKIPEKLDDDEWAVAFLRSELVTSFAQKKMTTFLAEKKEKLEKENAKTTDEEDDEAKKAEKEALEAEKLEYLKSLRFNVNVFLPDIKSLEGIDDAAFQQMKKDEEMVREAATYLWEDIIPGLTAEIRQGVLQTIPHDGKSVTELMHQRGINCRYLGRLAMLALVEEEKDIQEEEALKQGKALKMERRKMPLFWLELLECEMIARAAKHILDLYVSADGATVASSPAQTIASFLSALVSECEETAAQTEIRMGKLGKGEPDEDEFAALTVFDAGGNGDAAPHPIRGRFEVWKDIEEEIGRRFRYSLTLYNRPGKNSRAIYVSLLRRICQRTGVRLMARSYDLGGKCFCGDGSVGFQIAASHPITALDIVDIIPLMKHAAAHGEGFVPCGAGPGLGLPPLHISLLDARNAVEAAHIHHSKKSLSRALDLAQEAASLYQRVTDTPAHPGIVRCMDLMAAILFDAGEPELAASNGARALGLLVQVSGFDSPDVINLHFVLFQFYATANKPAKAVKHIRAAIYLMDLVGGPHHFELSNAYHKCGSVYHGLNDLKTAKIFFDEAAQRESPDRFLEGVINKSAASIHAALEDYKVAVANEKRAYQLFSVLLGPNHDFTKQSDAALKRLMKAAVDQGSRMAKVQNIKKEEEAAAAIAHEIEAEEAAKDEKRRKNKNGQKKKNKSKK